MITADFEAALGEPESDASISCIYQFATSPTVSESKLPVLIAQCLNIFANRSLTHQTRRWTGIALSALIDSSPKAGVKLKTIQPGLQQLGDMLLNGSELEELKIIAGIAMRSAMEKGVEMNAFWSSNKAKNSVPKFPQETGQNWVAEFQQFMDTLADLVLFDAIHDPCLLYPVSLMSSDNFQWINQKDVGSIVIVENTSLTFIALDGNVRQVRFVEIPLRHIRSITSRASELHDSQARTTNHEPWDVILMLRQGPWNYRLDTSLRSATQISILFRHAEDAQQCEASVKELLSKTSIAETHSDTEKTSHEASKTNNGLLPKRTRGVGTSPEHRHDETNRRSQPIWSSSSSHPIDVSASRSPRHLLNAVQTMGQGLVCPEQLGQGSNTQPVARTDAFATAKKVSRRPQTQKEPGNKLVSTSNSQSAPQTQKGAHSHQIQLAMVSREPRSEVSNKSPEISNHVLRNGKTISSSSVDQKPTSRSQGTQQKLMPLQALSSTTGKLSKVLHNPAKISAQNLLEKDDVFDVPEDLNESSSSSESKQTTKSGRGSNGKSSRRRPPKGDDGDDEFVPQGSKVSKNANKKRKASPVSTRSKKPQTKKPRTQVARVDKKSPPIISSADASSEENRIDSQNQPQAASSSFKKPTIPTRALQSPPEPANASEITSQGPEMPLRGSSQTLVQKQYSQQNLPRPLTPPDPRKPPSASGVRVQSVSISRRSGDLNRLGRDLEPTTLSSNSKPLPASPTAESTAISGHANSNDIVLGKRHGDVELERNDPFKRHRTAQHITSFARRLSGEDYVNAIDYHVDQGNGRVNPRIGDQRIEPHNTVGTNTEDGLDKAISQSLRSVGKGLKPASHPQMSAQPRNGSSNVGKFLSSTAPASFVGASSPTYSRRSSQHNHFIIHEGEGVVATVNRSRTTKCPRPQSPSINVRQHKKVLNESEAVKATNDYEQQIEPQPTSRDHYTDDSVDHIPDDFGYADETTLINTGSPGDLPTKHTYTGSSPPPFGSPSSHSSTSAEPEPLSEQAQTTSEAEQLEWEASLQPHQRNLHEALIHVSKRVLQHVVDSETAVADIADMYLDDGQRIVTNILERHEGEYATAVTGMQTKKAKMQKEMDGALKRLRSERARIARLTL